MPGRIVCLGKVFAIAGDDGRFEALSGIDDDGLVACERFACRRVEVSTGPCNMDLSEGLVVDWF